VINLVGASSPLEKEKEKTKPYGVNAKVMIRILLY
jgi:hypothetical protein